MKIRYDHFILLSMLGITVLASDLDLSNIPPTNCPIESKQAESCWLEKAKNVASIGAAFWATWLTTNYAHELGHKVTAKALFPPHTSKITLSLNPFGSTYTNIKFPLYTEIDSWKWIFFFASGAIAGLMANYIILKLSAMHHAKKEKEMTYKEVYYATKGKPLISKEHNVGLQAGILLSSIYNISSLMPTIGSDGYRILETLGKSHLIGKYGMMVNILTALTTFALTSYGVHTLYKIYQEPSTQPIPPTQSKSSE